MTTPAQGKGKKKNKEVTKLSLDEFNQTNAGEGYSVINLKTGLDWAEAMADYDKSSIVVPVVPRSQRGPDVDFESLPNEPPFRASLFNVPMSVEEKEIRDRFFQGMDLKRVEITKASTTVEFYSKQDLYDALCKNGTMMRNRTIEVLLYGQRPEDNRSDRYGRSGTSSYGDRGGRSEGGGFNRTDRGGYNDRGYNRNDRDNYGGFNRGGASDSRGGPAESRGTEDNWRARPATVIRQQPPPPTQQQNYQSKPYYSQPTNRYNQYQNHPPQPPSNNQMHYHNRQGPMNNTRPINSWGNPSSGGPPDVEERPKLVIKKRETPLDVNDVSSVKRNEAIFGQAKPSSKPYEKMKEIEEKLNN